MKKALLALGWLWALPTTLLGLLLAAWGGATPYKLRPLGVWQWVGTHGFWGHFFDNTNFEAITFGAVTIFNPGDRDDELMLSHERVHTRQTMVLGALFLPAYGLASLVALLRGKPPYRGNWFEVQAYEKQGEAS